VTNLERKRGAARDVEARKPAIHVGQAIRLDLHRRKAAPEEGQGKNGPCFVNFRLVAAQELSDLRGNAGNMNMQLVLKLKLVKRQMYGRAKIDLLQARLIGAS
jgi:hypothetical protein